MNIKNYLIKKLGGITKEEDSQFRKACEIFARNNLIGRYGITCFGGGIIDGMDFHDPLVIVAGPVAVYNSDIHGLAVAPWAITDVEVSSCRFYSPEVEMTRRPPLIEIARIDIAPDGYVTGAVTSNRYQNGNEDE